MFVWLSFSTLSILKQQEILKWFAGRARNEKHLNNINIQSDVVPCIHCPNNRLALQSLLSDIGVQYKRLKVIMLQKYINYSLVNYKW